MKKNLNEEISRIKGMMGKIMTESFEEDVNEPYDEENIEGGEDLPSDDMIPDGDATLRNLRDKVKGGAKVTINGHEVFKMPMNNLVTFVEGGKLVLPRDGEELEYNKEIILVDGNPLEIIYKEKPKPIVNVDNRTPEEKLKAQRDWEDRYGPNGGYDTAFGRYTGD